jgi:sugar lactone lactonase YvrE
VTALGPELRRPRPARAKRPRRASAKRPRRASAKRPRRASATRPRRAWATRPRCVLAIATALALVAALGAADASGAHGSAGGASAPGGPSGPGASAAASHAIRVFARMPPPGYPANAVYGSDGLVYAGSFKPLQGGTPDVPSKVFAFARDGHVVRSYTVTGQTPGAVHAVQVATTDRQGRLYLLDQDPARVVVLDPRTGAQSTWATFATLPGASPPEPDFAAWGPDGSLYVTDYAQFVVWRIPPAGGAAKVWLSDPLLNGTIVGPAGIELMADGHMLMLSTGAGGANPTTGKLYTVAIRPDGSAGPLKQVWESAALEAPDGFAIARSGDVYVALVGPTANAVVEISPAGRLLTRIPANPIANELLPVPFDAPGSVTFDGTEILVGNQSAINQDQSHMALLAIDVGETGLPVSLPPATSPVRLQLTVAPARVAAGRPVRLRFSVLAAGRPVAGALVTFRGLHVSTDPGGHAAMTLRFTTAGRRTFTARADGYLGVRATVRVVRAPVRLMRVRARAARTRTVATVGR